MSDYVVSARKWRPMIFEDVAGQAHITQTLRNAIASQRLAHAYLFSGPRGVGKTTTARLLAKAINCNNPVGQNPDNACENCVEITEGRSFDVLEIDGASNRGVDEIRNLRESVRYAPSKGRYKVYIIDEVHMLTKEAFNALLKTLEEPPPQVVFIFATTEINKVPATILSRCQRFDFRRIKTDDIAANLRAIAAAEGLHADDDALLLVARKADGSLRDAQSLFDQVIALCGKEVTSARMVEALNMVGQEMYFRVTDLIKAGDVEGGLALVNDVMTRGYDLREFIAGLMEHFRNMLVAKATGTTTLIEAADVFRQRYQTEAGSFSIADILRLQRLAGGTESALRWTTQPRFRLEADIVQMISMPRAQDVGELLVRLDELKKKPGSGPPGAATVAKEQAREPREVSRATLGPTAGRSPSPGVPTPGAAGAPAVQQTPAPSVIAQAEISSRWQEFLSEVRTHKISLWSAMESTQLLSVEGSVVRLGCPDGFQADMATRNKDVLADMFQKVFSVRPKLVMEVVGGGNAAARVEMAAGKAGNPASPKEEHPVIAAMKRELGAEPI